MRTLLLAACQYPGGVLDRTPAPNALMTARAQNFAARLPGPAQHSWHRLGSFIDDAAWRSTPDVRLLWAGDGIYIDATAGLFDPATLTTERDPRPVRAAALRRAHQASRQPSSKVFTTVEATVAAIDDHEIQDNWEPSLHAVRLRALAELRRSGRKAFRDRGSSRGLGLTGGPPGALWGAVDLDGLPLFVGDTRTQRSAREAWRLQDARIMRADQRDALHRWLNMQAVAFHSGGGPAAGAVAVLTPSILLPRRLATTEHAAGALRSDAWDGYPVSLHDLLATLVEARLPRCLFLSGDEHVACGVRADVWRKDRADDKIRFWSIHTGAMYAPYPFANGRPENFSEEPWFDFTSSVSGLPVRYRCALDCRFGPVDTDGFVSVDIDAAGPLDDPRVRYHGADGVDYSLLP